MLGSKISVVIAIVVDGDGIRTESIKPRASRLNALWMTEFDSVSDRVFPTDNREMITEIGRAHV